MDAVNGQQAEGKKWSSLSCGCKFSGYVPVQAVDWNRDGWMDLVFTDTYASAYILVNSAKSKEEPTFERKLYFKFEKKNHGMYSGGGDWNGDGVADFLYMPFAGNHYRIFPGKEDTASSWLKFLEGPRKNSFVLKISGEKAKDCAWAWPFLGRTFEEQNRVCECYANRGNWLLCS